MKTENFFRAALTLLIMLLTATTAWAGDVTVERSTTSWTSGNTYNVTSDVTINASISVSGPVTLNLGAGTTLTVNQTINVSGSNNWLTITGNGTLIVHGPNGADGPNDADGGDGGTGVNGNLIINSGTVTITGGNGGNSIPATGNDGLGGSGGAGVKGNLIVNGGTVTVNGSDGGVGFEPALDGNGIDGSLTLNGGTVTINMGRNLAGLFVGITGDITLAGGTLVFPNIDRYSCAFDYDRNVVIDGYIYKYIYENSVGYLTGSLDDDQKKDLYDKPLTLLPEFAGEGTEGDPYLITSYNDLLNLRNDVNGGEAYDGKYFKQTADIDWPANTTWTSGIGTDADHRFGGHYNGGGNAIRHLTINGTSKYTALFGYVCGASNGMSGYYSTTLKNIVLEDCNIDASSVSGSYASGICASIHVNSSTRIDNCRVSGTISGTSHASGIICKNSTFLRVTNCFADVTVSATHKGKIFAEVATTYGDNNIVGNYYHDNGDGVGSNGNSYNLTASQVAPLYTVSSTNLTAAATNATVTHAGTHYFAAGATATLATDGNHIISGTPTVSGTGATYSLATDNKSMTVNVGTQDVTVSATLGTVGGSCGDNATWSLAQDGSGNYTVLTISGTGAMQDYDHDNNSVWRTTAPWGYGITSVTIGNGITTIGKFAFCGCQQLSSITIGNSVTTIGDASINHCDALTELTLPASVASIGNGAFHNDVGLTRLNIQKTDGLVTLAENTIFHNCNALQAIVVPTLALAVQYQSAQYWSTHAAKLRAPFGSQLFAVTTEGGTAAYVIANATDWNNLATAVNAGANGSGQTFRQTANITVSNFTPIGNSEANSFRGTYDGGSKTLTATCNAVSSNYVAPFGYLYGTTAAHASVKDLSVVTTITAAGYKHIAGLIALHSGYVDVTNCNANVTISSTVGTNNPTDLYPAALVSQVSSDSGGTLTVTGCTATGTIATNGKYAGGLVGTVQGTATINDCLCNVTINSSTAGDGSHGGLVGLLDLVSGSKLTITGCVFTGKLLTKGTTATNNCGGFVGWNAGTLSISNSLYAPAAIEDGETEVLTGNSNPSATFARDAVNTLTNCYYTRTLGTAQGKAPRTVTAGDNVTIGAVSPVGSPTSSDDYNGVYTVSGITAYATGITRTVGQTTTFYYGKDDEVSLTLTAPQGYQYGEGYTVSGGTLNGTTLTMPDADVTVSAALVPIDWATESTGADYDHAYMIYNKDQLDLLATRVNNGTSNYSGKYFKLGADIHYDYSGLGETGSNYTAIGGYHSGGDKTFSGHFDGQNHVVSGIRIYKGGNTADDRQQALFGYTYNAEVKNVILADAHITGYQWIGGIVGYNDRGLIENCHVLSDVTLHAVQNNSNQFGGIAGIHTNNNTVTGCTSAARITVADGTTGCNDFGGIAGYSNRTISNCLYLGNSIEGTTHVGAIVGYNCDNVNNCYYASTAIRGKSSNGSTLDNAASTVGYNDNYGTLTGSGLAPQDNADNSIFISLMAARNTALTAVERTTPLDTAVDITLTGRTLYKDGDWNTLCLPFDVTISGSPLTGATVKKLTTSTSKLEGSTLYLYFEDETTTMTAGTPYLIKWDSGENLTEANLVFTGVTIDKTDRSVTSTDGTVSFKGTYTPIVWNKENQSILFLGTKNTLYYPQPKNGQNPRINAFRAYFQLADGNAGVREFKLNFGDGESQGIKEIDDLPIYDLRFEAGAWYTIDGVKLDGKPTKKGLYIHGDRKVVVK